MRSTAQSDMDYCKDAIRHGSLSFHAASTLLPKSVREPCLALYAFCRLADDEVDLKADKSASVRDLISRLDDVYAGRPRNRPMDRAFTRMVQEFDMPRALPEALLEGLLWDALGKEYDTFDDLVSYAARVASAVGAMMCVIMGMRDADVLARACDLGVAMQLTNIARDVGEDAREGRLYIPRQWLAQNGLARSDLMAADVTRPEIQLMTRQLLSQADQLYHRSEAGIARLPIPVRPAMFAARHIYAAIGDNLRDHDYNNITRRARTDKFTKLRLLGLSATKAAASMVLPTPATVYARPLPQTEFLVRAAAIKKEQDTGWSDRFISVMEQLSQSDQSNIGA